MRRYDCNRCHDTAQRQRTDSIDHSHIPSEHSDRADHTPAYYPVQHQFVGVAHFAPTSILCTTRPLR